MITAWTDHVKDPEEKQKLVDSIKHSRWLFELLEKILDKRGASLERAERSPRVYDTPNWAEKQAHVNGYMQCLTDVKDLINLDHKETK